VDECKPLLYGRAYRCNKCSKAVAASGQTCFNAYDADVIDRLPTAIKLQLPFVLTHRGAVWRSDADLLQRAGLNIADFVDGMAEVAAGNASLHGAGNASQGWRGRCSQVMLVSMSRPLRPPHPLPPMLQPRRGVTQGCRFRWERTLGRACEILSATSSTRVWYLPFLS
jgi:hypothetical protein